MSRADMEQVGKIGERWVVEDLRRRGYTAEWIGKSSDYDVLIEGAVRAEVKSALLGRYRGNGYRWQFSLRRHGLDVDEDLLFLLCYDDLDEPPPVAVFIIPGNVLPRQLTQIDITSQNPREYRGKWQGYLDAWENVERVVGEVRVTKPTLFRSRTEAIPF